MKFFAGPLLFIGAANSLLGNHDDALVCVAVAIACIAWSISDDIEAIRRDKP